MSGRTMDDKLVQSLKDKMAQGLFRRETQTEFHYSENLGKNKAHVKFGGGREERTQRERIDRSW